MLETLRKSSDALDKAAFWLTALVAGGFTLLLFSAVVCRYIFKVAILFEEEGSKILFVWGCFIAATIAYKRKAHIYFNFVERAIGPKGTAISDVVIQASSLALVAYLFVESIDFLRQIWDTFFPLIGISQGWLYLSVTVALAIMIIHSLLFLIESLKALFAPPARKTEEDQPCSLF